MGGGQANEGAVQRIKKAPMAPVPCREGMDAEAKAPCVGAAEHVREQTMSTDKLASPWKDSDCPSEVSTLSRLSFCCSVVSR